MNSIGKPISGSITDGEQDVPTETMSGLIETIPFLHFAKVFDLSYSRFFPGMDISLPFSPSSKFTQTFQFVLSLPFHRSFSFSLSKKFTSSNRFNSGKILLSTPYFSNSDYLSPSLELSSLSILTDLNHFSNSIVFSSSIINRSLIDFTSNQVDSKSSLNSALPTGITFIMLIIAGILFLIGLIIAVLFLHRRKKADDIKQMNEEFLIQENSSQKTNEMTM